MQITKGNGATINTDILEILLYSTIRFGQNNELNPAKNPTSANYITSSHNDDTQTFNASVIFPVTLTGTTVTASDYLTSVTYTLGSGGTFSSANWVQAIIELSIAQWKQEINGTKNPEGRYAVSWRVEGANDGAKFNASYSLPTEWSLSADASWSQTAREYLID